MSIGCDIVGQSRAALLLMGLGRAERRGRHRHRPAPFADPPQRQTGEHAYLRCYSARPATLHTLVTVAGQRWRIEESFQTCKGPHRTRPAPSPTLDLLPPLDHPGHARPRLPPELGHFPWCPGPGMLGLLSRSPVVPPCDDASSPSQPARPAPNAASSCTYQPTAPRGSTGSHWCATASATAHQQPLPPDHPPKGPTGAHRKSWTDQQIPPAHEQKRP